MSTQFANDTVVKNMDVAIDLAYDLLAGAFDERTKLELSKSGARTFNKLRYKINELVDLLDDYENMVVAEYTQEQAVHIQMLLDEDRNPYRIQLRYTRQEQDLML